MKKTIAALFAIASAAVFAGYDDLVVTFSTPGPDKYADGSTVLDNECYSLVYIAADKTVTQVITVPAAKDGKCQPVIFCLSAAKAAKYTGGEWGVFLLDTRDFTVDSTGNTLSGYDSNGKPELVNVSATVADGYTATSGMYDATSASAVAAGSYDLSSIPTPKVTGIQIVGANVVVTVEDTVPYVGYTLQSGTNIQNFSVPEGAGSASGKASDAIKLVTPKGDGAQFFKVSTIQ